MGGLAAVALAGGTTALVCRYVTPGSPAAKAEVRSAFTQAMRADLAVQGPPTSWHLAAPTADRPAGMPDAAQRRRQLADGLAVLSRCFTPAQARHEAVALRNVVAEEAEPTFRNLGRGVSAVDFRRVSVSGSRATVRADVTAWSKAQDQQRPGGGWNTSDPVNVMDYTATLVRDPASGRWLVSSLKGDFVPGEGP